MIFLWISILCSTLIYLTFKLRKPFNANLSGLIITNYATAAILGLSMEQNTISFSKIIMAEWFPLATLIGVLFVVMFLLIGRSTEKAGIAVITIATRMSMVIPILFSMFLFDEQINMQKIIKIAIAFIAVVMAIYHHPEKDLKPLQAFLPLILFVGSGSVDTLVKAAQHLFITENEIEIFSSSLFGTSFIASLGLFFTKKKEERFFSRNSLVLGVLLGFFNFGSLFFLINALNNSGIESSLVFGINNLSIVCLSLVLGYFFFKEKLTRINWMGIILSIICILLLIQF